MSLMNFLEKIVVGPRATRHRQAVEQELSEAREKLETSQSDLRGEIRQHEQISHSATRVLQNMTHAMIMMEAEGGRRKK